MSKFQKQNLVKVPFHFVSQQKTRSSASVFDVALAVRPFNCIFCPVKLQMVIFDFKEEGTGTEHVAIAISKCVPSRIFLRVQHPCQVSIALLHYWRRYS